MADELYAKDGPFDFRFATSAPEVLLREACRLFEEHDVDYAASRAALLADRLEAERK